MDIQAVALWMHSQLEEEGCIYQDDVVDYLVKSKHEHFLRENADGNLVLSTNLLNEFKKLNHDTVVWVSSDKYWLFRVLEDEDGRNARG